MSLIMTIGDVHLADRPPSSCTEDYLNDLFDLLRHCARVASERKVTAVIQAGDLFHLKAPNRNSHRLVQSTIEMFQSFPCPVYIVPGNHDLQNDRFESLFVSQPLGVVLRSGAAYLLSGWNDSPSWMGKPLSWLPTPDKEPLIPVYGIPWLMNWNHSDDSVRKQSVEAAVFDLIDRMGNNSTPTLLVTHAPFYPPGDELKYENYPTSMFAESLVGKREIPISVYYGHVHESHGIFKSGGVNFANHGAISRGSIAEHNLTREIAVTLWDSETGLFERVPLPHKPASEVFRLQEIAEVKQAQVELDAFLQSVGATTIEITSIESVLAHVRDLGLAPEVVQLVEELLAGV